MVLTVSPQGQVTERLLLHPSVNNSGYIVKVLTHASTVHVYVAHTWAHTHDIHTCAVAHAWRKVTWEEKLPCIYSSECMCALGM